LRELSKMSPQVGSGVSHVTMSNVTQGEIPHRNIRVMSHTSTWPRFASAFGMAVVDVAGVVGVQSRR